MFAAVHPVVITFYITVDLLIAKQYYLAFLLLDPERFTVSIQVDPTTGQHLNKHRLLDALGFQRLHYKVPVADKSVSNNVRRRIGAAFTAISSLETADVIGSAAVMKVHQSGNG